MLPDANDRYELTPKGERVFARMDIPVTVQNPDSDEYRMVAVKRAALIELDRLFCDPAYSTNVVLRGPLTVDYIRALATVVIACRKDNNA